MQEQGPAAALGRGIVARQRNETPSLTVCHGRLLKVAKPGGRTLPGHASIKARQKSSHLHAWPFTRKGSHLVFWEEQGLGAEGTETFYTVPSIFPTPFSWQLPPTSPQTLHDAMVPSPFHHLLRANVRFVLRHICESSSDPPQRFHKVQSLPVLTFRVMFPLQQCDFLPKIRGR